MSISSSAFLFGSALLLPVPAKPSSTTSSSSSSSSFYKPINGSGNGGGEVKLGTAVSGGLVIECSSRPQKKATKHHMKTRPKKSQPWDIRREPTVYPPLPPLPPDWTLVSSADRATVGSEGALPSGPALQAPVPGG